MKHTTILYEDDIKEYLETMIFDSNPNIRILNKIEPIVVEWDVEI